MRSICPHIEKLRIGDTVIAYRIRHPFTVAKVVEELEAVVLEYPTGEFTRLIPIEAIESTEEAAARRWIPMREARMIQRYEVAR
jgi:hypothetical protein